MPGRFVSITGTGESKVISRSTGEPGDIRNEGGHSGLIRKLYKKRSAVERFFSWIEAFKKITLPI